MEATAHRTPAVNAFFAKRDEQDACQQAINEVYADHGPIAAALAARLRAEADHAEYRQYDGYWAGPEWKLVRVTCRLESKGGVQADAGDVVLARVEHGVGARRHFYSVRLGWMCSFSYGVDWWTTL